jgi:hypothetical protein
LGDVGDPGLRETKENDGSEYVDWEDLCVGDRRGLPCDAEVWGGVGALRRVW